MFFAGILFVVLALNGIFTLELDEPTCVSKFDYDYKILRKLIDIETEMVGLKIHLNEQKEVIDLLKSERKNHGSTYTIWGMTTCPGNDSTLVYSGFMAGKNIKNPGDGTNYLCLTSSPLWGHYEENSDSGSRIYGVEYQFSELRSSGSSKYFGQHVYNKNAPCVLCHISRGTNIMIPGRNQCFHGWTKEYSGYLVSSYRDHEATEYVCLADNADLIAGSENDDNESTIYLVEGRCGKSLPCPPYVNKREITCVVCSL